MSDPIDPIGRAARLRAARRKARSEAAPSEAPAETTLPVPVGDVRVHAPDPAPGGDAAFAAQLMAGAPKRGLKGGPETLTRARTTYLETEYSGARDRRAKKGVTTKTDV